MFHRAKRPRVEVTPNELKDETSFYSIYLFHSNCPDDYTILNTPHTSIIKFIRITPASTGSYLVACDGVQRISLWRMQVILFQKKGRNICLTILI